MGAHRATTTRPAADRVTARALRLALRPSGDPVRDVDSLLLAASGNRAAVHVALRRLVAGHGGDGTGRVADQAARLLRLAAQRSG